MPFGVNSAPEEFECKLQEHLSDLNGVDVLRDDVLVQGQVIPEKKPMQTMTPT